MRSTTILLGMSFFLLPLCVSMDQMMGRSNSSVMTARFFWFSHFMSVRSAAVFLPGVLLLAASSARLEALGVELGFRCDITPGILILDGVERFLRSGKIVEPFRLDTRNAKQRVVGQHMAGVAFEEHPIPIDSGLSVLPQHGTLGELLHRQRRTEERRRAVPPAGIFFVEVEK